MGRGLSFAALPLDRPARRTSWWVQGTVVTGLFIVISFFMGWAEAIVTILPVGGLAVVPLWTTTKGGRESLDYVIRGDRLMVNDRLIGTVHIAPLAGFREAYLGIDLHPYARWGINKGWGWYQGRVTCPDLGVCRLAATDLRQAIVLHGERTLAVSPEDVDGFLSSLKEAVPGFSLRPWQRPGS